MIISYLFPLNLKILPCTRATNTKSVKNAYCSSALRTPAAEYLKLFIKLCAQVASRTKQSNTIQAGEILTQRLYFHSDFNFFFGEIPVSVGRDTEIRARQAGFN